MFHSKCNFKLSKFVLFCPTSKIHALYPVKEPYKQVQEILSRLLREYSSPFLSLSKRFLLLANYLPVKTLQQKPEEN